MISITFTSLLLLFPWWRSWYGVQLVPQSQGFNSRVFTHNTINFQKCCFRLEVDRFWLDTIFLLGNSSMNSNVRGQGGGEVKKKHCNFHLETATFEPGHENKNCSACPADQLKPFKFLKISNFKIFQIFQIFQLLKFFLVPSFCRTFRHFFAGNQLYEL